jgi:hypothetical protein
VHARFLVVGIALFLCSAGIGDVQAAPRRFNVAFTFAGGASGSGTLVYDSDTLGISYYSISVAADDPPDMFTAATYDFSNAQASSNNGAGLAYPYLSWYLIGPPPTRMLFIAPTQALDGNAATVPMQTSVANYAIECFDCVGRAISAGAFTYVPPSIPTESTLVVYPPTGIGGPVEMMATISGSNPYPGGGPPILSAYFTMDGAPIAFCNPGVVGVDVVWCIATNVPAGTHEFRVDFRGNTDFLPSAATATMRTGPVLTTTRLEGVPDTLAGPGTVQVDVKVAESESGANVDGGIVSIIDFTLEKTSNVCVVAVVAGKATCSANLGRGDHTLSAIYQGTGLFASSADSREVEVGDAMQPDVRAVPISRAGVALLALMIAGTIVRHARRRRRTAAYDQVER